MGTTSLREVIRFVWFNMSDGVSGNMRLQSHGGNEVWFRELVTLHAE